MQRQEINSCTFPKSSQDLVEWVSARELVFMGATDGFQLRGPYCGALTIRGSKEKQGLFGHQRITSGFPFVFLVSCKGWWDVGHTFSDSVS